jgi:hypothetical protein
MPMSADKITEGEEGKKFSLSNNKIPTAAKLYAAHLQNKRKSYKAVDNLCSIFCLLWVRMIGCVVMII